MLPSKPSRRLANVNGPQTLVLFVPVALLLLLVAVVAHVECDPISSKNSGDWLARELGMDDPKEASKALDELKNSNKITPASDTRGRRNDGDLDGKAGWRDITSFISKKMESGDFKGALEEIDAELKGVLSAGVDEKNLKQVELLAQIRYNRAFALRELNRYMEALVELHRIRRLLPNDKSLGKALDDFYAFLSNELNDPTMGPYRALQMEPSGNLNRAYRKMMLLLHPDKNSNLDEELAKYIKYLYEYVKDVYDRLSKQKSK